MWYGQAAWSKNTSMKLICIYGYSFGCFVLVFLLCIVPAVWLHWLLMVYGTLNSIAFLVLNLTEYLESLEKKSYVVYGIIGAAQIFLFLMFKLVFFDLIYETPEWNDVSLSLTHWQLYFFIKKSFEMNKFKIKQTFRFLFLA